MSNRFSKASLLVGTIMASAMVVSPAYAQTDQVDENAVGSQADQDAGMQGETIVVTGSRIQRSDLTSTSPLTVVQDEEFKLSGAVNVESVINTLPQVVPGTTSFSNNPGGGVATLNLRGLGSTRNLVLVNGRRYIFYDANQIVDLNTIPQFLIDSVDVVTGGASAVYGSDALAGVINFNLRDDLNGVTAGGQYGITEEGDGQRYNAYVAIGSDLADGRGNVTAYAEYYRRGSIFQGDRDFSFNALGDGENGLVPGGSAGVPQGRFTAAENLAIGAGASCGGDGNPPRNAGCFDIAAGTNYPGAGAFFGTPGTSTPYTSANAYNYAPTNYLMVPQERYTLGGYGSYEITDGIEAYAEVAFVNNRVENELAATPITQNVNFDLDAIEGLVSAADFAQLQLIAQRQQAAIAAAAAATCTDPDGNTVTCPNPYGSQTTGSTTIDPLAPGQVRLGVNTRTTGISSRNVTDERNAFRVLAGFKGDLTDTLQYDAFYSYSRTRNGSIQEGNVSRSAFTALTANGTCNVFGENQLSPECVDSISILAQNSEVSSLQVAQASVSGPLFTSGLAVDPIAFALGVEYRKMSAEFIPDTALSSGDVAGFNAGQPTAGSYDAKEVFGELRVPVIQDGFIDRLEFTGGARYSHYSLDNVGGAWAYFGGAEFAPIPDITFRGQYQRAVRAPNVQELFGGQSVGFPTATDPCSDRTAPGDRTQALRDLCIATGVPASAVFAEFIQPNDQVQGAFGGNPNLQEEVSDTFTIGAVIRPSFIPGLNITVDYYDITIDNAISVAGGSVNNILDLCYNTIQDASSAVCGFISRDDQGVISGPPFVVSAQNANLASLETSGVDFQLDYMTPIGASLTGNGDSRLGFFFLGNYTEKNNFTPLVELPDEVTECAGKFGLNCGNPTPEWKWSSRLSWMDGPMTTSFRWRHVGKVTDDDDTTDYIVEEIGSYDLFDLSLSWEVNENFTFTAGVNNLFDKRPPLIGSNQEQANTYPGVYDVLGRDYFVSVGMDF
ncbi:TonB-dependent receptor domain-containing protein [Pelagerythrobacter sp.]|uniref:TonB-dependent receptor domain-containing protein n=1 Tax=Pelagerythrobacter sp. TaxID=2800702 RepID=UPI0035B2CA5D